MVTKTAIKAFQKDLPAAQLKLNEPLAKHTTLKIGGPADLFFVAKKEEELIKAVELAKKLETEFVVLGWGSNVLISDSGFRGLVIKNQTQEVEILGPAPELGHHSGKKEPDRHERLDVGEKIYQAFDDLDYDETSLPAKLVQVSSGVILAQLINWTHDHKLTGLQWFSRIPGTIGGALYNNIHGGAHYFEELAEYATILDEVGKIQKLNKEQLDLGYDRSRFHSNKEVIINVGLRLYDGDVERAKEVAITWAKRKSHQPHNSAGCTFKNISQTDKERLGYKTTGTSYVIEWILKKSNKNIGGARISNQHHGFIVNDGHATAADVLKLMREIAAETKKQIGIKLEPEIFFIGFSEKELEGVY